MEDTSQVKCPECDSIQSEDIYDLTGDGDMEGSFLHVCEKCNQKFMIEFEYRPFVNTY